MAAAASPPMPAPAAPPPPSLDYWQQARLKALEQAKATYKGFFRLRAQEFIRGKGTLAVVTDEVCMGCTHCFDNCAFEAIDMQERKFTLPEYSYTSRKAVIIEENCVGCEKCAIVCPVDAIGMVPKDGWYVRDGRLVQLGPPPATPRPFLQPPKPGAPRPPVDAERFVAFREEAKKAPAKPAPKPAPTPAPSPAPEVEPPPTHVAAPPQASAPQARPAAARRTLTPEEVRRLREEARKKALAAKKPEEKEAG